MPEDAHTDASPYINYGIDTPLLLTKEEDRPMWKWIHENEQYKEKYHETMKQILEKYISSRNCEDRIDSLHELLRPYVEKDPSAFYDVNKFDKACEALKVFVKLRSDSIFKQLKGELSTRNKQQDSKDYIDASKLRLDDMQ